jgi:hypothetical protein
MSVTSRHGQWQVLKLGKIPMDFLLPGKDSYPDMTLNVYGRSRWERKADLARGICERVLSGLDTGSHTIMEPEQKVAGWDFSNNSDGYVVRGGGLEPPRDFSHKALNLARLPIPPSSRKGQ